MNKGQLIDAIVNEKSNGIDSKAAAERAVEAVITGIRTGLKKDKDGVQIVGFGTFTVKSRKARMGRNPRTGEPVKIKASKTVGFKAGAKLKGAVAGGK